MSFSTWPSAIDAAFWPRLPPGVAEFGCLPDGLPVGWLSPLRISQTGLKHTWIGGRNAGLAEPIKNVMTLANVSARPLGPGIQCWTNTHDVFHSRRAGWVSVSRKRGNSGLTLGKRERNLFSSGSDRSVKVSAQQR